MPWLTTHRTGETVLAHETELIELISSRRGDIHCQAVFMQAATWFSSLSRIGRVFLLLLFTGTEARIHLDLLAGSFPVLLSHPKEQLLHSRIHTV